LAGDVCRGRTVVVLDHHLRDGNSLVGGRIADMGVLPGEIELRSNRFKDQLEAKVSHLLAPLAKIAEIPSETADQIQEKEQLYRQFEEAREPFRLIGDVWCSFYCPDAEVTEEQFQRAIEELARPQRFARVAEEAWFRAAVETARTHFTRCFHWSLIFPRFTSPEASASRIPASTP
jgi:hypothetical protein